MVRLFTDFQYPAELLDVVKLFFADAEVSDSADCADVCLFTTDSNNRVEFEAKYLSATEKTSVMHNADKLLDARYSKRYAKIALYTVLSKVTGKTMPWGSLTGIRPTKLARQLIGEGADWRQTFCSVLGVSQSKASLVADIMDVQGDLSVASNDCADLYVGIPFCVSRCSYCSFTGGEIERLKKYVEPYVDALIYDIKETLQFASKHKLRLKNVYFGGGTPTSLSAEQLQRIMECIDFAPEEYTVEAGRPDTLTEDKLRLFRAFGVDRVSVNPQTFNQSVLDAIGRKHTVAEIYDKYALAKNYGFTVNMDLIAGLPTETADMFKFSIDEAVKLSPDNVTVHTLALKRGSALKADNYYNSDDTVKSMVEYAHSQLYAHGYLPYYMYRQKYMSDNLENVGFCKRGTACAYNVGIMEEITNVLACGAGAISKRIFSSEDRIERAANAKDVITYVNRTDDYVNKKIELFAK